jgi:hypothetical protein
MNFMNHVGIINDSQVVILHKSLKCVYQKDFLLNKKNINQGNLSCWVIGQKQSLHTRPIWHWPLTLKSIGVIYWPRPMNLWILKVKGPWVGILIRKRCYLLYGQRILDLWPFNAKISLMSFFDQKQCIC